MKIRNGFVSNSSSSSFVIIGKTLDLNDVTESMLKDRNIYILTDMHCEGEYVVKLETMAEIEKLQFYFAEMNHYSHTVVDAIYYNDKHCTVDEDITIPKGSYISIGSRDNRSDSFIDNIYY